MSPSTRSCEERDSFSFFFQGVICSCRLRYTGNKIRNAHCMPTGTRLSPAVRALGKQWSPHGATIPRFTSQPSFPMCTVRGGQIGAGAPLFLILEDLVSSRVTTGQIKGHVPWSTESEGGLGGRGWEGHLCHS